MEFQAKIFVSVRNPGARIAELGGPFVMGSVVLLGLLKLVKAPNFYEFYCIGLLVLGLLCMIGGRIIAKGNLFRIGLSDTDLVAEESGVRVGEEFFSHGQLTDLSFWVEGYDGQPTLRYGRFGVSRGRRNMSGSENKIHFRANGKKHLYQFYLPDQGSMSQLGQVFRVYYERRIPFRECNQGGPTFLFRQVRSKNELEDMKRREGFV